MLHEPNKPSAYLVWACSSLPGFDEPVELHFHDLRGTTVTLLSESGSNPQQIATIVQR